MFMKLLVIVEQDETGYYVAEVPALPGCVSQGRTLAEAKTNVKEAISGWLAVMNDRAKRRQARTIEVLV
jgi:predicted RNase H-like HicB family nuclease